MNQNYAVIEDGVVTNVVVFDPSPEPKSNWIQSDDARIGDLWDGKKFITPKSPDPAPEPKKKSDLILAALIAKGVLTEDDVKLTEK